MSPGDSHLARPCGPSLLGELLKTPVDTRGLAPDVPLRDDFNGTGLHPIAGSGLPCLPGAHRPRRSAVALLGSSMIPFTLLGSSRGTETWPITLLQAVKYLDSLTTPQPAHAIESASNRRGPPHSKT